MSDLLPTVREQVARLSRACAMLSGLCFIAIFIINILNIALRTWGRGGLIWVTDLSQLLLLWMVMLGTAAAYHAREHIVVDFLVARLAGLREALVAGFTRAVEIGLFVFLLTMGIQVAQVRSGIAYIQLGVPTSWGFAAIPTAATVLLVMAATLPLRFERQLALDEIEDTSPTGGQP